jgi:hypothetical protein
MGWIQLGYQLALAALTTGIFLKGTGPMKRTIAAVFGSMVAGLAFSGLWPGEGWSALMIAFDALACIVITWHPAGRWQSVIGLSYILQIGVHIGRIANGDSADLVSYWWGLALLAVLQLLLIGGWWITDVFGFHLGRRNSRSAAAPPRHPGVV